jgi:hypothetical protein
VHKIAHALRYVRAAAGEAMFMRDLLAPGDERDFTAFLCQSMDAKLLLSDLTTGGKPHLADEALASLPEEVPGAVAITVEHAVWRFQKV